MKCSLRPRGYLQASLMGTPMESSSMHGFLARTHALNKHLTMHDLVLSTYSRRSHPLSHYICVWACMLAKQIMHCQHIGPEVSGGMGMKCSFRPRGYLQASLMGNPMESSSMHGFGARKHALNKHLTMHDLVLSTYARRSHPLSHYICV